MSRARAWLLVVLALTASGMALPSGCGDGQRAPRGMPGKPPPFQGVALVGSGEETAAVDAYGNLVDVRAPGPAGEVRRPVEDAIRGTTAGPIVLAGPALARAVVGGRSLPLWRADTVRQRYLPGTNVLVTVARFGDRAVRVERAVGAPGDPQGVGGTAAARADRGWLSRARPLGGAAPRWAGRLYRRSLLVLRALTDRRTGAVVAGVREGWAYVWPRDAAAVAIAFASAGYRAEARRIVRFLLRLDLSAAARFHGDGSPVPGREAQGDAAGWVAAAARGAGLPAPALRYAWRDRADYQEKEPGEFLANAIAASAVAIDGPETGHMGAFSARRRYGGRIRRMFASQGVLTRKAADSTSGVDSAAAWAVRPFSQPRLFRPVRASLRRLIAARGGRFGIVPSQDWPGQDPWTAPTAWSAWAFAALARDEKAVGRVALGRRDRRAALSLMASLRRAATPLGLLPERVDAQTGLPTSTTPLSWSHAFAILAIRELWPGRAGS